MATYNMGYTYNMGKRVGYDISCPNGIGGRTLLSNVSSSDKSRIMAEMRARLKERHLDPNDEYVYDKDDVEAERITDEW